MFLSNHLRLGKEIGLLLCLLGMATALVAQPQPLLITTVAGYAGHGSSNGVGITALFSGAQGVATDAAGNVYVADTGNNVVRIITPGGVSSTLAGSVGVSGSVDALGTNALFNQPCGIGVDSGGNVYVSDFGSSVIRKITPIGQVTTIAGTAEVTGSVNNIGTNALFFHPMGIAVDSVTNIYVADYGNHLIRKISAGNVVSTLAGSARVFGAANGTGTGAQFYEPEAVTVDPSGTVYVADTGNAAIRMITSTGVTTTLAGSPGALGSADGTGTNAYFYQPDGIAISGVSNIYVSDYFNNTIRQVSTSGAVLTIAGLAGTTGSADGVNSLARFAAPQGLAVNSAGTVFIADTANSTVRMMTPAGVVTTLAGSASVGSSNGAAANARFYSPQNIAIDSQANVYVADTQNNVVRKISPSGVVSILAGTPGVFGSADGSSALFSGPQGIAVDASGNVYVADTGNSTIRKITAGGVTTTFVGAAGNPGNTDGTGANAQFYEPEGVAVDSVNNIYVADTWNHTIRKITSAGVSSTLAGLAGTFGSFDGANSAARFNNPTGIAVDGSGNLYVTDYNNDTIREVTPAGVVITLAGLAGVWGNADGTGTNASFFGPTGISVDSSGDLFVIDSANDTLRELTVSGGVWTVATVAGLPDVSGSLDGTGAAAEFYYPAGVAVSSAGYVYVADSGNNTIRSQAIPPGILTQPQSQTTWTGNSVIFNVSVYGSSPFAYTWNYNGTNYPVSGSSSLVASNAGNYTVIVSNLVGQITSAAATLTLTNPPAGQPGVFQNTAVISNGVVQFFVSGTPNATYTLVVSSNLVQWTPLFTFLMTNGAVQIVDTTATNSPSRYYLLASP